MRRLAGLSLALLWGCGLEAEKSTATQRQALGTPQIVHQTTGFPPANGVIQGGPEWLGECGGHRFVVAGDIRTGLEPHTLTDAGMALIRDLVPGPRFSVTGEHGFACVDGVAYWIGGTGAFGFGDPWLWRSDGTGAGTSAVARRSGRLVQWSGGLLVVGGGDLHALDTDGGTTRLLNNAGGPVERGGVVYFSASTGVVHRTDGTVANTVPVSTPLCGSGTCSTQLLDTPAHLYAYVSGNNARGFAVLRDDGGVDPLLGLSNAINPIGAGDLLAFVTTTNGQRELWTVDADLDAGPRASLTALTDLRALWTHGDRVWLRNGNALFTVGAGETAESPVLMIDGGAVTGVGGAAVFGDGLLVSYSAPGLVVGLVEGNTVTELTPVQSSGQVDTFSINGAHAHFTKSGRPTVLWRTDGTRGGTTPVAELTTTTSLSQIEVLGSSPAGPLFLVSDQSTGTLMRVRPGTTPEALRLTNSMMTGLMPTVFPVEVDGGVVMPFAVPADFWFYDGTDAGVRVGGGYSMLRQGARAIEYNLTSLAALDTTRHAIFDGGTIRAVRGSETELLFATNQGGVDTLWTQQGIDPPVLRYSVGATAVPMGKAARAGNVLIANARANSSPGGIGLVRVEPDGDAGLVFAGLFDDVFEVGPSALGNELNRGIVSTDGLDAGLIWWGKARRVVQADTQAYFIGALTDGGRQDTIWRTDGTATGTWALADVQLPVDPPLNTDTPGYAWVMRKVDGDLFFFSAGDALGNEPWVTDGTVAGTHRVADLAPGPQSSNPRHFTRVGDDVYFVATSALGEALYSVSLSTMTGGGSGVTGGGSGATGGGVGGTGGGNGTTGGGDGSTGGGVGSAGGGTGATGGGEAMAGGGTGGAGGGGDTPTGCGCTSSGEAWLLFSSLLALRRRRA